MFEARIDRPRKSPVKKPTLDPVKTLVTPAKLDTRAKYWDRSVRMKFAISLEKQLAQRSIDIGNDIEDIETCTRRGFR